MRKLLMLLVLSFSLFACQQEEILSPPKNVRYQEETIVWDHVEGATSYKVMLNDVVHSVTEPLFNMHNSPNGDYTVRVSALKNDSHSLYSTLMLFTVNRMFDHPVNLSISEDVLTWQSVADANSYVVLVNDIEYPTINTMIELSFLDENRTHVLRVKAVFDLGESAYSSLIEYLTYFEVVSTYNGIYNINISYDLLIYFEVIYVIDHVYYNNGFLDASDFVMREDGLSVNHELLEAFELGNHTLQLYTSDGIVELLIQIMESTKPVMVSSNSVPYVVNKDIELIFEVFEGSFEALTGHDIQASDYDFTDGILTIYATYLDPKIATFTGNTIIFNYQLKDGNNIILGYIFIRIP